MFVVYQNGVNVFAKDLNSVSTFAVQGNSIIDYYQNKAFANYDSNEEAVARFNDIIEAASADQKIYDLREKVGYWKPKKAGRKPAAEKAPVEHHQPAPKK